MSDRFNQITHDVMSEFWPAYIDDMPASLCSHDDYCDYADSKAGEFEDSDCYRDWLDSFEK